MLIYLANISHWKGLIVIFFILNHKHVVVFQKCSRDFFGGGGAGLKHTKILLNVNIRLETGLPLTVEKTDISSL